MNEALMLFAGILIGYSVARLRHANQTVREILSPPRNWQTVTVTQYEHDGHGGSVARETFILGGRVPQEPT